MAFQPGTWPPNWPEIDASVRAVMEDGSWGRYKSPHQDNLCDALRKLCQVDHVRLCGSGSAAVELALRAARIGSNPGDSIDEVAVAAFDYPGNFRAIESVGARPVLLDVAPQGLGIDPEQVAALATMDGHANIRGVIASHLYGRPAAIADLREICDQHDWVLIEDACQTPGMTIEGKPTGSFGHIATLSFGGSKPLTAGNGGAIVTNENRFIAKLNALLDRPSDSQPLSTLQAAVLLPQIAKLPECNAMRQATVQYIESELQRHLPSVTWLSHVETNVVPTHYKVAWSCESPQHRSKIMASALTEGLPIGEGFRSMGGSSERRCRKPFPLDRSTQLGETTIVLDHSALLIEPDRHDDLEVSLRKVF